jgi:hypothetical protein
VLDADARLLPHRFYWARSGSAPISIGAREKTGKIDIITHILITGSEGYLGSLLTPELIRQGYEVIGLDTGFYKEKSECSIVTAE